MSSPACWTGGPTTTKRHGHTPEQIVPKRRKGERMLNEGKDIAEVVPPRDRREHLPTAGATSTGT